MTIKLLIVDDHSVVRQGLHMFLSLDDDLEVVGEAMDGAEAIEKCLVSSMFQSRYCPPCLATFLTSTL